MTRSHARSGRVLKVSASSTQRTISSTRECRRPRAGAVSRAQTPNAERRRPDATSALSQASTARRRRSAHGLARRGSGWRNRAAANRRVAPICSAGRTEAWSASARVRSTSSARGRRREDERADRHRSRRALADHGPSSSRRTVGKAGAPPAAPRRMRRPLARVRAPESRRSRRRCRAGVACESDRAAAWYRGARGIHHARQLV